MKKARFEGNETVQVGCLDTASALYFSTTPTDAFTTDTVVNIAPTNGEAWIQIGESVTAATADTAGNTYISTPLDVLIKKDAKIVATDTVCVTPYE